MVILKTIEDSILNAQEPICQQCNCVTLISHGLSKQIADKYPWADVYKRRKPKTKNSTSEPSTPGTILIDKNEDKTVIHMFGQVFPGKPNAYAKYYPHVKLDDCTSKRIEYFKLCLEQLDLLKLNDPVAMPYKIGCGLAGGSWDIYQQMLHNCSTKIILYKLD